jgi:predicted tellurium resistance membrane protein TerC
MDFTDPQLWAALLTLTALEIVLGIDNIIFLSIVVAKLPEKQQPSARILGLAGAMLTRIGLLFSLAWLASLTKPWFSIASFDVSGRDLVLFFGGLFLLWKATIEIHESLEGAGADEGSPKVAHSYWGAIIQIMILDIVFSLDSVITAVGMTNNLPIMVTAIVIAIGTMKVLALAFLIMVGGALVAESWHVHVPKGYLYFAMAFSVGVEMINLRLRSRLDRTRSVVNVSSSPGEPRP